MQFYSYQFPTTLLLFSEDNSKSLNPKVSLVVMKNAKGDHIYPTQALNVGPMDCFDALMNNLQSGNIDFDKLQEGMDKCLHLGLNNDNSNNTEIIPPPHEGNNLRFV